MKPSFHHTIAPILGVASLLVSSPAPGGIRAGAITEPSGDLRLPEAIALTLARNPHLEPYSWEIRLREAAALQAAMRPNPELGLEVENAAGSGSFGGFDAAEETISLSQTIELGRKRRMRGLVAGHDVALARHGYVLRRAEILSHVTKAFLDVIAAQQELGFARESLEMQQALAEALESRVQAGKLPGSERETSRATTAFASIALTRAEAELEAARSRLGAHWGNAQPRFQRAAGTIEIAGAPAPRAAYERSLANNPILAYHAEQIRRHEAAITLEEAQRLPDVTVGVGLRHFEESGDHAAVFSVSVPLSIFNRRRAAVARARAELGKAEAERQSAVASLRESAASAYLRLGAAHREAAALASTAVPAAERRHRLTAEGYALGKSSYLEVQAARDSLLEARAQLLRARIRYHKSMADLETLAGNTH